MGDSIKNIIRLGFIAAVIVGGIIIILGLQRAMASLGQTRNKMMVTAESIVDTQTLLTHFTTEHSEFYA